MYLRYVALVCFIKPSFIFSPLAELTVSNKGLSMEDVLYIL